MNKYEKMEKERRDMFARIEKIHEEEMKTKLLGNAIKFALGGFIIGFVFKEDIKWYIDKRR